MPDPVILELAVNGATPRSRNRHVPQLGRQPATIRDARRIIGIGRPVS